MRLITLLVLLLLASCQRGYGFPEDQLLDGPFRIGPEWQTIVFDPPLKISRDGGGQSIRLVVDNESYSPGEFDEGQIYLLDESEIKIRPEVILKSDGGKEVEVHATSLVGLFSGGLALGYGKHIKHYSESVLFDQDIRSFTSMSVRSDEPLVVDHLSWKVDSHPDIYRCNGRKCTWLENIFR